MEKINLFEADFDFDNFLKEAEKLKKSMSLVKKEQNLLKASGQETSKEFVENAALLKGLTREYNARIKVLSQSNAANFKESQATDLLNIALDKNITSISEARAQNKLLNKLRNDVNVTTEEGREQLKLLNDKLDENNEFIKENADAYLKQKINIGNYSDSIKEAFGELNIFNGGLLGFIARSKEAGGAGNLVTNSLKTMTQGVIGLTKSTLAFIATPIGALLALLVGAFALVKNAMNRSEEATGKITKIFGAFSGITNSLLKALQPLGEFLIDGIVIGFEAAAKAADGAVKLISRGLRFLGFDSAADSVDEFTGKIEAAAKAGIRLATAEKNLEKAQRNAQLIQLEYQRTAEKLRQTRDDESLSIAERIKANEELGVVLANQLQEELAIAELALEVANLRIDAEGQTKEALDAQAEALTRIADIQERVTGQESEQLVNRISLQKEAADKAREAAERQIKSMEDELAFFVESQGVRAKSREEQLALSAAIAEKEIEIAKKRRDSNLISETEFNTEMLRIKNELAEESIDLAVSQAERELEIFLDAHQRRIEQDKFFSDEAFTAEQERLAGILQAQQEFHALRLEQGAINEQEYNDAINLVNEENRIALVEAQAERDAAIAEQRAADLALERENQLLATENEFERQRQILENSRLQEIEAAEKSGASITKINEKFAKLNVKVDAAEKKQRLDLAQNLFGNIASLLGEQTAAGKAAGIAQATINTFQGVTEVWKAPSVLPEPFNTASKVVATATTLASGLAAVKQITSVKAERGMYVNEGGVLKGNSHAFGGINIEAEGGEYIINKRATAKFKPLLDDINSYYGNGRGSLRSNYYASGGQVLQGVNQASQGNVEAIREAAFEGTKEGLRQTKIVAIVDDINAGQDNVAEIEAGASV